MKFVKHERISLQRHPEFSEKWVQERIAEDPSILGLGDLILKDKERMQPRAGRLDLLLQDPETDRRYEVELQLGKTDESHIIRTIEYWDLEKKRYPQYDHCGVLVAEDVTSRFLNVIGLFNNSIPLIAIQMNAITIGDQVTLTFTTVLDEFIRGLEEEGEEIAEPTDRAYWLNRAGQESLAIADALHEKLRETDPQLELNHTKHYIGLARGGSPDNFVIFVPLKKSVRVELRLKRTQDLDDRLAESGLDTMPYTKWGRYRVRLNRQDLEQQGELLDELLRLASEGGNH